MHIMKPLEVCGGNNENDKNTHKERVWKGVHFKVGWGEEKTTLKNIYLHIIYVYLFLNFVIGIYVPTTPIGNGKRRHFFSIHFDFAATEIGSFIIYIYIHITQGVYMYI